MKRTCEIQKFEGVKNVYHAIVKYEFGARMDFKLEGKSRFANKMMAERAAKQMSGIMMDAFMLKSMGEIAISRYKEMGEQDHLGKRIQNLTGINEMLDTVCRTAPMKWGMFEVIDGTFDPERFDLIGKTLARANSFVQRRIKIKDVSEFCGTMGSYRYHDAMLHGTALDVASSVVISGSVRRSIGLREAVFGAYTIRGGSVLTSYPGQNKMRELLLKPSERMLENRGNPPSDGDEIKADPLIQMSKEHVHNLRTKILPNLDGAEKREIEDRITRIDTHIRETAERDKRAELMLEARSSLYAIEKQLGIPDPDSDMKQEDTFSLEDMR